MTSDNASTAIGNDTSDLAPPSFQQDNEPAKTVDASDSTVKQYRDRLKTLSVPVHSKTISQDEWNQFIQFVSGEIAVSDYLEDASLRNAIQTTAYKYSQTATWKKREGGEEFYTLNANLYLSLQETRGDEHWSDEVKKPENRAYIDVLRIVDNGFFDQQLANIKHKYDGRKYRSQEIQIGLEDAFEKAVISRTVKSPDSLPDYVRTTLNRSAINLIQRSRDVTSLDSIGTRNGDDTNFAATIESSRTTRSEAVARRERILNLIEEINATSDYLSDGQKEVFQAIAKSILDNDGKLLSDLADDLGINHSTLKRRFFEIRQNIVAARPDLHDEIIEILGGEPKHIQDYHETGPERANPRVVSRVADALEANGRLVDTQENGAPNTTISEPQIQVTETFHAGHAPASHNLSRRKFMSIDRTLLDNPETEYQKSLGFRIAFHQTERDMSNSDLASSIKDTVGDMTEVDAIQVHKWQTNQELPNSNAMEAMVQILIKDNDKIAEEDKQQAIDQFHEAYEHTQQAIENMQHGGVNIAELSSFSNKLFELRSQVGLTDHQAFAEAINNSTAMDFPEYSEGKLDPLMIARIHGNDHVPSNGMMLSMVKALDSQSSANPITDEDKAALYELHAANAKKSTHASKASNIPQEILDVKAKLAAHFKDEDGKLLVDSEGKKAGNTRISEKTGLAASVISQVIGTSGRLPSVMGDETIEKYSGLFIDYLKDLGKTDEQAAGFKADLEALNEATRKEKERLKQEARAV